MIDFIKIRIFTSFNFKSSSPFKSYFLTLRFAVFSSQIAKKTFQILNIPKMMTRNDLRFQTYMFNSFFFETLLKRGYAGVKRWTRKVDIFSYDIILVPIHLTVHWCMAVRFFFCIFRNLTEKKKGKTIVLIEFSFLHPLKPMWLGCSRGQVVVGWPFSSSLQHWPASNFKAGQFLRAARAKLGLHKGEATVRDTVALIELVYILLYSKNGFRRISYFLRTRDYLMKLSRNWKEIIHKEEKFETYWN